jgi:hypothetical protein
MAIVYPPLHAPMGEIHLITVLPAHYGVDFFPWKEGEKDGVTRWPDLVHYRLENVCLDDSFLVQEHGDSRSSISPTDI